MGEAKQRGTRAERVAAATRRDDLPRIRAEAQIGVAPNGKYSSVSGDGNPQDLSHAVCAVVRQHADKRTIDFVGTGFFVAKSGLFVTARHVLDTVREDDPRGPFGLGIIQFIPGSGFVERPVRSCIVNNHSDIGIGVSAEMTSPTGGRLDNPVLHLSTRDPAIGEPVFTYAYPDTVTVPCDDITELHINPHFYEGKIEEHFPVRRDASRLTWPCFQTSIHLHGGSSGGPVFDSTGAVFGVNTASMAPYTDVSYVTKVRDALELVIDGISVGEGAEPTSHSLRELAKMGFAVVDQRN
ncbi:S1 family peptidase [Burkholderia gladioli]|uniref:S1 family peptidase n=1 Tax=Burkholderia gladioli TaxID=28095 RepID=UPI00163EAE38|nr:serine protease [Burkholderia gladioli]